MTNWPSGFPAQINSATGLTPTTAFLANSGAKANVATKALRGCLYTAASTGASYTATRTVLTEDFYLTVNANTTITLAGGNVASEMSVWNIVFVEDATGGHTIAVNNVRWAGYDLGETPTFTTTAHMSNHCSFVQYGTGPIWGYFGGAVAAVNVYVLDTFTRANAALAGSSPEVGPASWVISGDGTWNVVSNKVTKTVAGSAESIATVDSGVSDCTVSADVTFATGTNGVLVFRALNSTNFNVIILGGGVVFYTIVGGVYTAIASSATPTAVNGVTYNIKVVASGTSVLVYVDNVLYITTSSATNQTRTAHGLRANAEAVTIFDNFMVTS